MTQQELFIDTSPESLVVGREIDVPAEVLEWADDMRSDHARLHAVKAGDHTAHPQDVALYGVFAGLFSD